MSMEISVILCTFNRCRTLGRALASVAASQIADAVSWEVLVVDNNSKDRTREVVEGFSQQYPNQFRYLFEPQQGKSHALNRGIREAEADVLVFMDDDVEVDSMWLDRLVRVMRDKRWSGCGGRILPEAGFVPPRWLETERHYALAPLALFDLGSEAGELKEPPFGTNMAFRKEMFSKYGGFRIDLGPQPGSQIRSEDTEFGARLLSGGERLWYEPSAVVYHPVTVERLQKKYFLAWWYDKARAEVREDGPPNNAKWTMAGIPSCLFRRLIGWSIRWICALNPGRRFSNKLNAWRVAGAMVECYRQREDGLSSTAQATLTATSRPKIPS
jgi:glycosyltransferase involved in cell wall biosynthesis